MNASMANRRVNAVDVVLRNQTHGVVDFDHFEDGLYFCAYCLIQLFKHIEIERLVLQVKGVFTFDTHELFEMA